MSIVTCHACLLWLVTQLARCAVWILHFYLSSPPEGPGVDKYCYLMVLEV